MKRRTKTKNSHENDWDLAFRLIATAIDTDLLQTVDRIQGGHEKAYTVWVSTIISLRTKDEVTRPASMRLLAHAPDPASLMELPKDRIGQLIYPAGFYNTKARNLKEGARIIVNTFGGRVPDSRDALMTLPGVGRKTANLVLNHGYGIEAICVDTHVHRIANRLGWVFTKTAEHTEFQLMDILPQKYWIPVNGLLVGFGRQICKPVSPKCFGCPLTDVCPRIGVTRSR